MIDSTGSLKSPTNREYKILGLIVDGYIFAPLRCYSRQAIERIV